MPQKLNSEKIKMNNDILFQKENDIYVRNLSKAVSMSLLEIAEDPTLLYSNIGSNLISTNFWDLKKNRFDSFKTQKAMKEINRFKRFSIHQLSEEDVINIWGWDSIEDETQRLDKDIIQYSVDNIYQGNILVQDKKIISIFNSEVLSGPKHIMRYKNSIYDLMHAFKKIGNHRRKVTCCDLSALVVSLAYATSNIPLENSMIIGSPFHYFSFIESPDNKKYLFSNSHYYDQNSILSKDNKKLVEYYTNKLVFDRIITSQGYYLSNKNISTIPKTQIKKLEKTLNDFFGFKLEQFNDIDNICYINDDNSSLVLSGFSNQEDIKQEVIRKAKSHPNSLYRKIFYSHRSLDVDHPEAYLTAATKDYFTKNKAKNIKTINQAIEIIEDIKDESIFNDINRISMPDEVLFLFKTGTHKDKALALYTLFYHSNIDYKENLAISFGEKSSSVYINGKNIEIKK